ncbi:hypothetical protein DMI65_04690 [Escherichia coli]|nr:hypothetical protein [Escherichia coli]
MPLFPPVFTITCLRTFAARHHCHGLTHLSGQNAKFYRVLGKILWAVHLPGQSVRQVVAVSPRRQGLNR